MLLKHYKALIQLACFLLCLTASFTATKLLANEDTTTVTITNGEWPPYLSQDLPHYGLASRIITEAFALEGITVKYGFFPWARSLHMTKTGSWDAAAVWRFSEERAADFYYSEPILTDNAVFFHLKTMEFDWNDYADLKYHAIGTTRGYHYGEEFHQAQADRKIHVEQATSDEHNFKRLIHGHINLLVHDENVGYYQLNNNNLAEYSDLITHHPRPVIASTMHLLFSKKVAGNKQLVKTFNRGLKKLKQINDLDAWRKQSTFRE